MAVDGSITFDTTLDNSDLHKKLTQTKKDIESLQEKMEKEQGKQSPLVDQAEELRYKIKQARTEAEKYRAEWAAGVAGADTQQMDAVSRASELTAQFDSIYEKIQKHDDTIAQYGHDLNSKIQDAAELEKTLSGVADNTQKTSAATEKLKNKTSQTSTEAKKLHKETNKISPAMEKAQTSAAKFARRLKETMKSALVFSVIYKAFGALKNWMESVIQTNTQAADAVAKLKGALLTLAQPLLGIVIPAFTALSNVLTDVMSHAAELVAALFGTTISQAKSSAEALYSETKALNDIERSARGAKKAMAGFDTINQLPNSTDVVTGSSSAGAIGADFSFATSQAQGVAAIFQPVISSLQNLGSALIPLKTFVSQGLIDLYNLFLVPVGEWVMGEGFPRFIDAISNGLGQVDWDKINGALCVLWESLAPFAVNVGEGLLWLWENVFVPFGTWALNEAVPAFLELVASGLTAFNAIWDAVKPGLE